uniref:Ribosomal protein S8 n=1 Tax=Pteridomonas sp. YPF1301 TaxID=2766739 RepID=A0A7G1MNC7_9STRA|nr:ribosomal protein S8 [Pteridomonas sp. YPF1301]
MINDSISNFLTCLRNGLLAKRQIIKIPFTNLVYKILKILKMENFIKFFKVLKTLNLIFILIEYKGPKKISPIKKLLRISKLSLRQFITLKTLQVGKYKELLANGKSICIISTSKGIMLDRHAKELNLGGELICLIS